MWPSFSPQRGCPMTSPGCPPCTDGSGYYNGCWTKSWWLKAVLILMIFWVVPEPEWNFSIILHCLMKSLGPPLSIQWYSDSCADNSRWNFLKWQPALLTLTPFPYLPILSKKDQTLSSLSLCPCPQICAIFLTSRVFIQMKSHCHSVEGEQTITGGFCLSSNVEARVRWGSSHVSK